MTRFKTEQEAQEFLDRMLSLTAIAGNLINEGKHWSVVTRHPTGVSVEDFNADRLPALFEHQRFICPP